MMLSLIRLKLLHMLGVDELVRKAFYEGWQMAHDDNFERLKREAGTFSGFVSGVYVIGKPEELQKVVEHSRCWRHVDEAWFNSDAEESL